MSDAEPQEVVAIDPLPDELALARGQIDSGLPALAEGTVRRRLAWLEAEGNDAAGDEMDALRLLLAEAAWRQHRPAQARAALESIRPGSARRHLPIALLIEAESLAAAGEMDRAQGVGERLLASMSADEVFELRRGMPGRVAWPPPAELRSEPRRPARAPWSRPASDESRGDAAPDEAARSPPAAGSSRRARRTWPATWSEATGSCRSRCASTRRSPPTAS